MVCTDHLPVGRRHPLCSVRNFRGMIVCKHFVYLHVEKTGGSWLRSALSGFTPWDWDLWIRGSYHQGWKDIPEQYKSKPILFTLRNPWDWYVSRYLYFHQKAIPHLGEIPREDWGPQLVEHEQACAGTFEEALPFLLQHPHSYRSERQRITPPNRKRVRVMEFSKLPEEVEKQLQRLCGPLPKHLIHRLRNHKPVNSTERKRSYRDWYTAETRKLVAKAESEVIQMMGYKF